MLWLGEWLPPKVTFILCVGVGSWISWNNARVMEFYRSTIRQYRYSILSGKRSYNVHQGTIENHADNALRFGFDFHRFCQPIWSSLPGAPHFTPQDRKNVCLASYTRLYVRSTAIALIRAIQLQLMCFAIYASTDMLSFGTYAVVRLLTKIANILLRIRSIRWDDLFSFWSSEETKYLGWETRQLIKSHMYIPGSLLIFLFGPSHKFKIVSILDS